ncbi:Pr6Pr family membrane protein [Perlabentimonas gracilis]|uniref:Pr6Pr family membrane protein n=1 Tax=Perlabentimonas gracilis TaxID=2715279 RepID=UPI00140D894B|nr:Pr6Pr family membrane protein [Perlabentimonas gracilis]NHB68146.1 hypothetical protein [Perlabentimonas gracilis]
MNSQRLYALLGALVSWFAVLSQFITTYLSVEATPLLASLGLLNYFTILTNVLVAISFTLMALEKQNRLFSHPESQTAILVYILVVGIVYSALLRSTWNPQGFQRVVDELLHTVVPLYYLIYWFVFTPKADIKYLQITRWLVYPALYLIYSLVRGAATGKFPYPFLNAASLGWGNVLFVCLVLTLFLMGLAFLFVFIGQRLSTKRDPTGSYFE